MFTLHPVLYVTCQVLGVTCQVSRVTCHVSGVPCEVYLKKNIYIFFFLQSGRVSWQRVCYQQSLPRLVSQYTNDTSVVLFLVLVGYFPIYSCMLLHVFINLLTPLHFLHTFACLNKPLYTFACFFKTFESWNLSLPLPLQSR